MQFNDWRIFALGSAFFAALTAVFGKIGTASMNSNLATFIRTIVIFLMTGAIISFRKEWRAPEYLDSRSLSFLILSGVATGASWLCYYRALQPGPVSKVAPVDKLSVALVIFMAIVFLGEQVTLKSILGGLFIVAGSILLAI